MCTDRILVVKWAFQGKPEIKLALLSGYYAAPQVFEGVAKIIVGDLVGLMTGLAVLGIAFRIIRRR